LNLPWPSGRETSRKKKRRRQEGKGHVFEAALLKAWGKPQPQRGNYLLEQRGYFLLERRKVGRTSFLDDLGK